MKSCIMCKLAFYIIEPVLPTLRFTHQIGLLWNCLPWVNKLLGRWPKNGLLFIRLPGAAPFSSKSPIPCRFREFLNLDNVQEHSFFSSISGIKMSWRLSTSCESQQFNCFSTQLGDFDYFPAEKHQNWENWVYDYLIEIGLLWSHLLRAKKPIYHGLVFWSVGNTE